MSMAEVLKDKYNLTFLTHFSSLVSEVYPIFNEVTFMNLIFDHHWETRELKQRIRHISHALATTLPPSYEEALAVLNLLAPKCRGFEYLFFPDFVEAYGLNHWNESIVALKLFTFSSSSEFAVRPFIEKDPLMMMKVLKEWAQDDDHHVRRLASEGCRPRLPWATSLKMFIEDPSPILPILSLLKADQSEYVRKSVANNLNDISKDHPELVKKIAKDWKGQYPHTDWILKHGCRTLLRKADSDILSIFGFETNPNVLVEKLSLSSKMVVIGESVSFDFVITNPALSSFKLRVEYGIDFVKANGTAHRKLFKITENTYNHGETSFTRSHSFKDLSTRKHYEGEHRLSIVINGHEMAEAYFHLLYF
jgi:3-methyladenine DNA glycosylase AlkC